MAEEATSTTVEESKTQVPIVEQEAVRQAPNVLDLVFCMDCTGSMGSYIDSAKQSIEAIVEKLVAYEKCDLRFGLVAYRDHPPQESTYITRTFGFTASKRTMKGNLDTLSAQGGGDGPEAVATGLYDTLHMDWRKDATKVVILISDAPPHGLGESGDGFPNGEPNGHDPIGIARTMASEGITVYTVGCEPAIQQYKFARAFLCSVAELTNGQSLGLSSSALLADVILGGAIEELGLQALMEEVQRDMHAAETEALSRGEVLAEEDVTRIVASKMAGKGVRTRQLKTKAHMTDSYSSYLTSSASLATAKASLSAAPAPEPAPGHTRALMSTSGGSERMPRSARPAAGPAPAAAPAAAPVGFLGGLMRRFSSSSSMAPPTLYDEVGHAEISRRAEAESDDDVIGELGDIPALASNTEEKEVRVEEDAISYEQVTRMVKKVHARTKA